MLLHNQNISTKEQFIKYLNPYVGPWDMLAVKNHLLDQFYPFSQADIKVIYTEYYNLWLMYDYGVVSRAWELIQKGRRWLSSLMTTTKGENLPELSLLNTIGIKPFLNSYSNFSLPFHFHKIFYDQKKLFFPLGENYFSWVEPSVK